MDTGKYAPCNVGNRTIFCHDNLDILQGINNNCIDLIYLDPPFNKKKVFTAPIGTSAEGASFKDIFTLEDLKDEWVLAIKEDHHNIHRILEAVKDIEGKTSYNFCYLAYMAIRLIECHRILKETGSLYLHCDPTMSHYLKIVLDCIFGEKRFRNEIVWCYKSPNDVKKHLPRKHDIIMFYAKSDSTLFNRERIRIPYADKNDKPAKWVVNGKERYVKKNPNGTLCLDWWHDIPSFSTASQSKERVGYPTQKPLALLERIIKASSNEGDMVLDPFCGCATTCVAAEKFNRHWVGVDVSAEAHHLVKSRLIKEVWDHPDAVYTYEKGYPYVHPGEVPLKRTDGNAPTQEQKYIYVISHANYPGDYKVGVASNVKSRLNSYQTGDPDRGYTLEYDILCTNYRELEHHIHEKFDNKYEWVHEDLQTIIKEIKKEANQPSKKRELF